MLVESTPPTGASESIPPNIKRFKPEYWDIYPKSNEEGEMKLESESLIGKGLFNLLQPVTDQGNQSLIEEEKIEKETEGEKIEILEDEEFDAKKEKEHKGEFIHQHMIAKDKGER